MTNGWIVNLYSPDETKEEERDQPPVFYTNLGEPVFEVWFWHYLLGRWFVMSAQADPVQQAAGVVYFHPLESGEVLRERVYALERAAGIDPEQVQRGRSATPS